MSSRVKTGCITCRIRRVKCDEGKPQCKKCLSSKRVCDGYLAASENLPRRQLATAARNLSVLGRVSRALARTPSSANPLDTFVSPNDVAYFDWFRTATVPSTTALFPSTFWRRSVLQVAHNEAAVWHAAVSMGIMHKCADLSSSRTEDRDTLFDQARAHYGKALGLAAELEHPLKLMTLSIVLVAAANMLGRLAEAQRHLVAGLKIVTSDEENSISLSTPGSTLLRTELPSMTFGELLAPYPLEDSAHALPPQKPLATSAVPGESYEVLTSEFFAIARAYYLIDGGLAARQGAVGPWLTEMDVLLRRLASWEARLTNFEAATSQDEQEILPKLSLRMYHATLRLMIKASPFGPESRFDALLGICEYIVRVAATVLDLLRHRTSQATDLSLEPGVVLPLWVVTRRCRHSGIRHAALDALCNARRMEGLWRSDLIASIMKEVVAVEEDAVEYALTKPYVPAHVDPFEPGAPLTAWQSPDFEIAPSIGWDASAVIPESKRVKDVVSASDLRNRTLELTIFMAPVGSAEGYGSIRQAVVSY